MPEPIENYDEEYVINCITPLLEFINNYGSVTGQMNKEARTDDIEKCEQKSIRIKQAERTEVKIEQNKQAQIVASSTQYSRSQYH